MVVRALVLGNGADSKPVGMSYENHRRRVSSQWLGSDLAFEKELEESQKQSRKGCEKPLSRERDRNFHG